MKKKIFNILKYTAFTALGVFLFWLVYRDQDFAQIWDSLKHDVKYNWVILSLFFGLLSHISRTLRWKIALEPLGEKPRTINSFFTVMIGYFMNLLLPRMGEFVRCGMLSKYEKIKFSKLIGTVVSERIIDLVMSVIVFCLVLILQFNKIIEFGQNNPQVVKNVKNLLFSPYLWGALLVAIVAVLYYFHLSKKKGKKNKIEAIINDFAQGIKSILKMKRYKAYIAHTLFIWLMYFLMLWVVFYSFDFTSNLGPIEGLTTFIMATFGMVAPVQGGIGAWHFMVEKTLGVYGVASANGKLFALLAHSSMNIMVVILGVICLILIPIINRNYHPKVNEDEIVK